MNAITKVSDIVYTDVADYLHLDELSNSDTSDINLLNNLIMIAKGYIKSWTGRTDEEMDTIPDFVIVVFILCQDMWDNRVLYVDKSNLNHVVSSILDMHSVNLL